jgi:hypothetical protein
MMFVAWTASGGAQQQPAQPAPQQFQPSAEWAKLPKMILERQFAGPLQDTVPMPSAVGHTSCAANTSTFHGEYAFGGGLADRLDTNVPMAITAGYAYGGGNTHGARVGLAGEF